MRKSELLPKDRGYYNSERPIGVFVLSNSMKEQQSFSFPPDLIKIFLYVITDWTYLFKVASRLRISLTNRDRWNIALDTTSFFLFIRIYFDTLASLIHRLFKLEYPFDSRKWPPSNSFNDQLKWFRKNTDSEFSAYKGYIGVYSFDKIFQEIRKLRNNFKEPPHKIESKRMVWPSSNLFINTGDLRKEIGVFLYKTVAFTDFVGDYFLAELSKIEPIQRMEFDHHGYSRGLMGTKDIETYIWFNQ